MKSLLVAGAAFALLVVATGLAVWEWPKERAPRFVTLSTELEDQLPGTGLLMLSAGVIEWNGSTLRVPARVLYVLPNERARRGPASDTLYGSVQVHLPSGPEKTAPDLLADMDARARYIVDWEGVLEWLEVRGRDAITGRVFSLRTTGVRAGAWSRYLTLELETYTPETRQ